MAKKTYLKEIDFSKTCFHNPLVIKHAESETPEDGNFAIKNTLTKSNKKYIKLLEKLKRRNKKRSYYQPKENKRNKTKNKKLQKEGNKLQRKNLMLKFNNK